MDDGDLNDEYVARLLKQDATDAKKKYELVGVGAFAPKRCVLAVAEVPSAACT